jgi:hypothetical protein
MITKLAVNLLEHHLALLEGAEKHGVYVYIEQRDILRPAVRKSVVLKERSINTTRDVAGYNIPACLPTHHYTIPSSKISHPPFVSFPSLLFCPPLTDLDLVL